MAWWIPGVVGVLAAALGVVVIFRPFSTLSVLIALVAVGLIATGVATAIGTRQHRGAASTWLIAVAWVTAGVVLLAWPDVSTRALAVVVGIALIVGGALDLVGGVRGSSDERLAAVIAGVASLVFGVLALSWPDVTLLVVAVVFGFRLVLFGARFAWSAFRERDGVVRPAAARPVGALRRVGHVAVSFATLVLALGLAAVSARINETDAVLDEFYDTPDDVPDEPGVLVRSEPFDREIPEGARAWRILYTTTSLDGAPAIASGLVVVPGSGSATPMPVIAWAHGTTGVARNCAPSVLPDPWTAGAFFALDRVIDEGWTVVATDYVGLGAEGAHPYLVGEPAGRSVLDAVRAARQLDGAAFASETVVWGHSQGGGAALWTGIVAPTYAPDVNVIGVAALAPASDVVGLIDNLGTITGGSIFAGYTVRGYANAYDDIAVADYVRPVARTTFAEAAGRCLNGAVLASILSSVTVGMDIFVADLAAGALIERLAENIPRGPIEAPLLVAQGESDALVLPSVQAEYIASRCAAGHPVDYRTYPDLGHVALVEADSPLITDLFDWTNARLVGAEARSTC